MKKPTAAEKRFAAINSLSDSVRHAEIGADGPIVTWTATHETRAAVATSIRALAPLGRTERLTVAVEAWAVQVEESTEETFQWAFNQYGIWAAYAAE